MLASLMKEEMAVKMIRGTDTKIANEILSSGVFLKRY